MRKHTQVGIFVIAVTLFTALQPHMVLALESDQYSNRLLSIKDSLEILDEKVNTALKKITTTWEGERDDLVFAREVYEHLGGLYIFGDKERVIVDDARIERFPQSDYDTIFFNDVPFWHTRFLFLEGVTSTITLNGVRVGTDKMGHFFYLGWRYFGRYKAGWDEELIVRLAALAERGIWGTLFTGIYSNADLVVNYEGLQFYRSLFENDIVPGKPAIVVWDNNNPSVQRPFTWADHVNDYWDEALNPPMFSDGLQEAIEPKLKELCDEYEKEPSQYVSQYDDELWERYQWLGLRDARYNRLDNICTKS